MQYYLTKDSGANSKITLNGNNPMIVAVNSAKYAGTKWDDVEEMYDQILNDIDNKGKQKPKRKPHIKQYSKGYVSEKERREMIKRYKKNRIVANERKGTQYFHWIPPHDWSETETETETETLFFFSANPQYNPEKSYVPIRPWKKKTRKQLRQDVTTKEMIADMIDITMQEAYEMASRIDELKSYINFCASSLSSLEEEEKWYRIGVARGFHKPNRAKEGRIEKAQTLLKGYIKEAQEELNCLLNE